MSELRSNKITDVAGTASPNIPGAVLQVVQGTKTDDHSTTSTSYVSGGLFVQITPKYATSKILVSFSVAGHSNTAQKFIIVDIARDPASSTSEGTALSGGTLISGRGGSGYGIAQEYNQGGGGASNLNGQVLDEPGTTNQITYLCVYRAHDAGTAYFNVNSAFASITAMEIGV